MALVDEKVLDINIDGIEKQKFRINGRDDMILELNTSDLGIADRLETGYEKLHEIVEMIANLPEDSKELSAELKKADDEMRKWLDYIFDSNVSEVCGRGGTMYDLKNGEFRFESILSGLTKLYTDNLNEEYKKMKKRIASHTEKYVPQDHNKKSTKSQKKG